MSGDIQDVMRRISDQSMTRQAKDQEAIITSYDPDSYAIKATLQPQGVETGWFPMAAAHAGNEFGITIGPEIGAQIMVGFTGGDIEKPFFKSHIFSSDERPPIAQSGEIVIKAKSGAVFKFDANGVSLVTGGLPLTLDAGGGAIALESATLTHNGKNIGDTHEHTGVTPGAALTGPPA